MLSKETKDQIAREAEAKLGVPGTLVGKTAIAAYIAGAETWAERGEVLKEALEKITKWNMSGGHIHMIATEALSNYNNHK